MSLFDVMSIPASGMSAQRTRAEMLAQNLANAETTRTAEGGPYRRRDVVFTTQTVDSPFQSVFQAEMQNAPGVAVSDIVVDTRDPERRYMPSHPDADKDGYVAFPRVNAAEDMVDLMGASRNFDANVSALTSIKEMINRSIDLLR